MKKITKIIIVVVLILISFIVIKSIADSNNRNYTQTYNNRSSLTDTFVRSAVRGAGAYTGYHLAKTVFKGHRHHSRSY